MEDQTPITTQRFNQILHEYSSLKTKEHITAYHKTLTPRTARQIAARGGSNPQTRQKAELRAIRILNAEQAGLNGYILAGQDAILAVSHHYTLICEPGLYGEPYSKIIITLEGRIYKKMGNIYLRIQ